LSDSPLVSVIVPVWNDAIGLARCLLGLRSQSYPNSRLQLIVVDNGSSDGSFEVAQSFAEATVLCERKPGSYAARNAGLQRAQGAYVAFIDSDCIPSQNWIEEATVTALRHPNLGVLGGRIEITSDSPSKPSAAVLYERMFSFNQELNTKVGTCVAANWLSPKNILERFGGFDASVNSGGDVKLSREISEAGHSVLYCDTMLVYHPARSTLRALLAKRRRIVGGKWATTTESHFKTLRLATVLTWDALLRTTRALRAADLRVAERLQLAGVVAAVWAAGQGELLRLAFGYQPRR
jgi:glycosyltransferase involved in cell wall biosynthesis